MNNEQQTSHSMPKTKEQRGPRELSPNEHIDPPKKEKPFTGLIKTIQLPDSLFKNKQFRTDKDFNLLPVKMTTSTLSTVYTTTDYSKVPTKSISVPKVAYHKKARLFISPSKEDKEKETKPMPNLFIKGKIKNEECLTLCSEQNDPIQKLDSHPPRLKAKSKPKLCLISERINDFSFENEPKTSSLNRQIESENNNINPLYSSQNTSFKGTLDPFLSTSNTLFKDQTAVRYIDTEYNTNTYNEEIDDNRPIQTDPNISVKQCHFCKRYDCYEHLNKSSRLDVYRLSPYTTANPNQLKKYHPYSVQNDNCYCNGEHSLCDKCRMNYNPMERTPHQCYYKARKPIDIESENSHKNGLSPSSIRGQIHSKIAHYIGEHRTLRSNRSNQSKFILKRDNSNRTHPSNPFSYDKSNAIAYNEYLRNIERHTGKTLCSQGLGDSLPFELEKADYPKQKVDQSSFMLNYDYYVDYHNLLSLNSGSNTSLSFPLKKYHEVMPNQSISANRGALNKRGLNQFRVVRPDLIDSQMSNYPDSHAIRTLEINTKNNIPPSSKATLKEDTAKSRNQKQQERCIPSIKSILSN